MDLDDILRDVALFTLGYRLYILDFTLNLYFRYEGLPVLKTLLGGGLIILIHIEERGITGKSDA